MGSCVKWWSAHEWGQWKVTEAAQLMSKTLAEKDYRYTGDILHQQRQCTRCGLTQITYARAQV